MMLITPIIFSGCSQIQGTKIFNFFNYKNILDYTMNCSVNYNISLNLSYCNGTSKRPIFYNYYVNDSTWNNVCCNFDSRCLAKNNTNVSYICKNFDANFTYISPVYDDAGGGSLCCNGAGACVVDHIPDSNCSIMVNATAEVATIAFNLSGTDMWDSICCISGSY